MNKVAVYWTLKKWFHNHCVMESAKWKLIGESYVEVGALHCVWYPCVKFKTWSRKWLNVEIYEVPDEWMKHLDWLEWYEEWHTDNLYNRITVKIQDGVDVLVYEIVSDIQDQLDDYYVSTDIDGDYFNWQ